MPNWCMNVLTVSGPGHEEMAALWRAGDVFSAVAPQPETFSEADLADLEEYGRSTFGPPSSSETPITQEDAWWWWRNKHWGTKWDVDQNSNVTSTEETTVIWFATAWSPPIGVLRTMSSLYPCLRLRYNQMLCTG